MLMRHRSETLPAWMFADPADVVERIENIEAARARRVAARQVMADHRSAHGDLPRQDAQSCALHLSTGTQRLINRARIQRLVAKVMRGR